MSKQTKSMAAALKQLLTDKNNRTLAALAAFNKITVEECALRILADELSHLHEKMNFQGNMRV